MTETVFSSSMLTIAVILLRRLFRGRISRRLQYALWLPVVARLLLPFPLMSSPVSAANTFDLAAIEQAVGGTWVPVGWQIAYTPEGPAGEQEAPVTEMSDPDRAAADDRPSIPLENLLKTTWVCGAIAVGLWFAAVNILLFLRLRKERVHYETRGFPECALPVYRVSSLPSPCLFGMTRPSIYLTPTAAEDDEAAGYVITHELCHHAHGDHLWSILRGLCLALHWFNPLVWLAASVSRTDCELACDEAVLDRLGETSRISYGRTLVEMIAGRQRPAALLHAGTTMASGRNGIRERIDLIVKNPRPVVASLVAVLLLITVAVGCTFTGPVEHGPNGEENPQSPPLALPAVLPGANPEGTLEEKIEAGLRNPNPLISDAWAKIQSHIEMHEETSREIFGDRSTKFVDAEITTLKLVDSFDNLEEDALIEVYLLQFRTLPKDISKVMFAGGMTHEGDWVLSQGSMGDPYLVARSSGADISLLGTIVAEGFGVLDPTLELLYRLEVRNDPSLIAASPIEISRVFALDDVSLTPEDAADLFTRRFIDSLREEENDLAHPQYKTFVVTDYRDVSFELYQTADALDDYTLNDDEITSNSWIVEPSASFRYRGSISSIGDGRSIPVDQWVTELYQGSRIGFLMSKNDDHYTFRSRFQTP